MNDREVLVITTKLDYSKAQSTEYRYCGTFLLQVPAPRYYFSKVPNIGTRVLLRNTVPTTAHMMSA